jgi:hypothetical protein
MLSRRLATYLPLLLAISLAAVLQAIHIARSATISADGITFISIARDLPQGLSEAFQKHDQHPGYPALLLGATRIVQSLGYRDEPGSWAVGGMIVAFACGLGSVVMVWLLARDLFDQRVANLAAIAFAALPILCWNAGDAHSDVPHLFAYLTAAWLATSGVVSGRLWPLAGAGAASALAYWIRPEGLEVFLIALVCLVWQAFSASWTWRRTGLACATLAGVTLAIAAPYPMLAGKITSKQLPFAKREPVQTFIDQVVMAEPKALVAAAAVPAEASAAGVAAAPSEQSALPKAVEPASTISQVQVTEAERKPPVDAQPAPRYTARLMLKLLGQAVAAFLNSIAQGLKFVFIPFYFLGHFECARRRPKWLQVWMLALLGMTHFVVLLAVFFLSGYIALRHVLPMVAIAMPFAALGILYAANAVSRSLRAPAGYVAVGLLALCCACVIPFSVRAMNLEFIPVMVATRWVEDCAPQGTGVVCNSPYVAFYGNLPVTYLSHEAPTLEQALAKAPPNAHYDFVILHVNAHEYQAAWIEQLERSYEQVRLFPDPSSGTRHKEVRVYRARDSHVGRMADAPDRSPGGQRN